MKNIITINQDSMGNHVLKNVILLLFLLLNFFALTAQNNTITGSVFDDQNEAIAYGNILLNSAVDSTMTKVELSDDSGTFKFINVENGAYFISISYVGLPAYSSAIIKVANENIQLPQITLAPATNDLEAVTVTAARPILEVKPDKMVFNVDGSINATGSDAFELLRKAPGVVVDNNENVNLLGKTGVKIYIDGKPSPMSGDQLANYLKTIPSSQIDAIEIITNPSARFDAEGGAGIINIKMKKDKKLGANAGLNLGYRAGIVDSYNGSVNGNYRNKNINIFGNYSYYHSENYSFTNLAKTQNGFKVESNSEWQNAHNSNWAKMGVDYFINEKSTIGILVDGGLGKGKSKMSNRTLISLDGASNLDSILVANMTDEEEYNEVKYNMNYQWDDGKGVVYTADLDYGVFYNNKDTYLPNMYYNADETAVIGESVYKNPTEAKIDIKTAKIDHERPFDDGKIEAGLKVAEVKTDNMFEFYNVVDGSDVLDITQSNDFTYNENVNAAYVSNSKKIGKFSYNYGLRAELTNSTGDLTSEIQTNNKKVDTTYFNLFPSAGVSFEMNKKNSFQLNYSRRINRPDYHELNPFQQRIDELTYQSGNPFLRPEYTNKIGLTHTYNYSINTTLSYSKTTDVVSQITEIVGDKGSVIRPENIAQQEVLSLNVSGAIPINKWWSSFTNLTVFHERYQSDSTNDFDIDASATTANIYMQHTFKLPKEISLEVSGWANSPGLWGGTFKTSAQGSLDLGLKKKLLANKASLQLAVTDIFKTTNWKGSYDVGGLAIEGNGGWNSRQVKVNFSYQFGNSNVKSRNRKTGSADESGRVKSGG